MAIKLGSECQRARHDTVCNNRGWRGAIVGDRGHGRAAPSSYRGTKESSSQAKLAQRGLDSHSWQNCLSSAQAKSGRMAVMAHALKLVAAGDKNIEY